MRRPLPGRTALPVKRRAEWPKVPAKADEKSTDEVLLRLIFTSLGGAGYIFVTFMLLKKGAEVLGNPLKIELEKYVAYPQYAGRLAFIDTFQSDFRKMIECYAPHESVSYSSMT